VPVDASAAAAAVAATAVSPRDAARSFVSNSNPLALLGVIIVVVMLGCALSLVWRAWGQNEALKEQNAQLQEHIQSLHALDALSQCRRKTGRPIVDQDEPDWDAYDNPFAPSLDSIAEDEVDDADAADTTEAAAEKPVVAEDIIARASAAAAAAVAAHAAAATAAPPPSPEPVPAVDFYQAAQPLDIDFVLQSVAGDPLTIELPDQVPPTDALAEVTPPTARRGRRAKRGKAAASGDE
jgi:hypothetical protein